MFSEKDILCLKQANSKVELINQVIEKYGYVTKALEDSILGRPAILMHLTAFAEQFDKLKKNKADEILSKFDAKDLKGAYDVRTYIAHDYEGVNLAVIEVVIKEKLPVLNKIILSIVETTE